MAVPNSLQLYFLNLAQFPPTGMDDNVATPTILLLMETTASTVMGLVLIGFIETIDTAAIVDL